MKPTKIVTINGRKYDAATGLPIPGDTKKTKSTKTTPKITSVQSLAKRPNNANSHTVKKSPAILKKSATLSPGRSMDIARSKNITHFAPRTNSALSTSAVRQVKGSDIRPIKHPLALKAEKHLASKKTLQKTAQLKTSKTVKDEAITDALKQADNNAVKKPSFFKRNSRFINIFSISAAILIVVGYLIYVNMPGISVRIASAEAGIDATYPDYKPDGYSLDGPVTYSDGQVTIKFRSNTGSGGFVIKQAKSSWDSAAVKNQVNKDSDGEFITTEENGLTIFTYDGNATWVNGGILYAITGKTHLSNSQIRHIAISL